MFRAQSFSWTPEQFDTGFSINTVQSTKCLTKKWEKQNAKQECQRQTRSLTWCVMSKQHGDRQSANEGWAHLWSDTCSLFYLRIYRNRPLLRHTDDRLSIAIRSAVGKRRPRTHWSPHRLSDMLLAVIYWIGARGNRISCFTFKMSWVIVFEFLLDSEVYHDLKCHVKTIWNSVFDIFLWAMGKCLSPSDS